MLKNELLSELYKLKLLGFEFVDDIKIQQDTTNLPSNLSVLKSFISNCHLCNLSKTRKNIVFGEGNIQSSLMLIGEAPGEREDILGRPFVGKAGELLERIITNVLKIKRSDIYIANILKCRPPLNRPPNDEEANCCLPYLFKQIEIINPKIIVALGSSAYKYLTNDTIAITKIRGKVLNFKGRILIPTYHPSYLLRNESAKKDAHLDFLKIKEFYENLSTNSPNIS